MENEGLKCQDCCHHGVPLWCIKCSNKNMFELPMKKQGQVCSNCKGEKTTMVMGDDGIFIKSSCPACQGTVPVKEQGEVCPICKRTGWIRIDRERELWEIICDNCENRNKSIIYSFCEDMDEPNRNKDGSCSLFKPKKQPKESTEVKEVKPPEVSLKDIVNNACENDFCISNDWTCGYYSAEGCQLRNMPIRTTFEKIKIILNRQ